MIIKVAGKKTKLRKRLHIKFRQKKKTTIGTSDATQRRRRFNIRKTVGPQSRQALLFLLGTKALCVCPCVYGANNPQLTLRMGVGTGPNWVLMLTGLQEITPLRFVRLDTTPTLAHTHKHKQLCFTNFTDISKGHSSICSSSGSDASVI